MKKTLGALALSLAAGSSWGATCSSYGADLGTLSQSLASYGASCSALGLDPTDPNRWTFTYELNFTMAQAGDIWGNIDLNFRRAGEGNPDAQSPGEIWRMVRIDPIQLVHEGITTAIGGESGGHNEISRFFANGIEAGDYTLRLNGQVFDTGTRGGSFDGSLGVAYSSVATPVPEPAAVAMLLSAAPLLAWQLRRRRTRKLA